MATLEKINYAEDTGTQAIQKLDRNQRKINDDVKIINMDGVKQQLTNLASNDAAQQQQIKDCLKKVIEVESGTSTKKMLETGIYRCVNWSDVPSGLGDNQGILIVLFYAGDVEKGWRRQIFISPHYNSYYVKAYTNDTSSEWEKILTDKNVYKNSTQQCTVTLAGLVSEVDAATYPTKAWIEGRTLHITAFLMAKSQIDAWTVLATPTINGVGINLTSNTNISNNLFLTKYAQIASNSTIVAGTYLTLNVIAEVA